MSSVRRLFEIQMQPTTGEIFQPTGFPFIGAAEFTAPVRRNGQVEWVPALLVESAQSMANRLEAVGWDDGSRSPVAALQGLPYVRVLGADGGFLTSSRLEAHRIASAFVREADLGGTPMIKVIKDRLGLGQDKPMSNRDVASAIFDLDPLCLLHGVFLSDKEWPGQPRIARAITCTIEAFDVRPVHTGGVKKDHVRHSTKEEVGGSSEGYGSIPYSRIEYVAGSITARVSIDLAQIASYGLSEQATELLEAIAYWEVATLFGDPLRLRTACDLEAKGPVADRDGKELATPKELADVIQQLASSLALAPVVDVTWSPKKKAAKAKASETADG